MVSGVAAVAVTAKLLSSRISIEDDEIVFKPKPTYFPTLRSLSQNVLHEKPDEIDSTIQKKDSRICEVNESPVWPIYSASFPSQMTNNPIRRIVDVMNVKPNPDKNPIKMSLGDPTVAGLFKPMPSVTQAITESAASNKFDGYGPSVGREEVSHQLIIIY